VTWDDLAWLRGITELPIVLKGIVYPEDAELAVEHGADGVLVSSHGGRQVDGAIGALDALPEVVESRVAAERGGRSTPRRPVDPRNAAGTKTTRSRAA